MEMPTIAYINSYMRSGSTLLGMLLGLQPDIDYLGETRNFNDYLVHNKPCFCGQPVPECPRWSAVIKNLDDDTETFETRSSRGLARALLRNTAVAYYPLAMKSLSAVWHSMKKQQHICDNISRLYHVAARLAGTRIVCDSSHRITQASLLFQRYPNKVKILHLVRDGRGVVNSVRRRKRITVAKAAADWKKDNLAALKHHSHIPSTGIIRTRYEDLCDNPSKEAAKICAFLGIAYHDIDMSGLKELHFVGGSSTIRNTDLHQFSIKKDESWKHELSERDKFIFHRIAGDLNDRYGYEY